MKAKILTQRQIELLKELSLNNQIVNNFYLSGGTALAEFYLGHRLSEDLDFFSENEFDSQSIYIYLNQIKTKFELVKIDFQQSFNRNLFFLHYKDGEVMKMEFTYYPFTQLDKPSKFDEIRIDSILDIATNKVFTIYQNPRTRDFIDLYLIIQKYNFTFDELTMKARLKFDWFIDPLQFGTQLMKAFDIKDYPKMLIEIKDHEWQNYFRDKAKKLEGDIVE